MYRIGDGELQWMTWKPTVLETMSSRHEHINHRVLGNLTWASVLPYSSQGQGGPSLFRQLECSSTSTQAGGNNLLGDVCTGQTCPVVVEGYSVAIKCPHIPVKLNKRADTREGEVIWDTVLATEWKLSQTIVQQVWRQLTVLW